MGMKYAYFCQYIKLDAEGRLKDVQVELFVKEERALERGVDLHRRIVGNENVEWMGGINGSQQYRVTVPNTTDTLYVLVMMQSIN
jgi:hypothetical protein